MTKDKEIAFIETALTLGPEAFCSIEDFENAIGMTLAEYARLCDEDG